MVSPSTRTSGSDASAPLQDAAGLFLWDIWMALCAARRVCSFCFIVLRLGLMSAEGAGEGGWVWAEGRLVIRLSSLCKREGF